jgi:mono/diheme cytochrome c family protein
MSRFKFRRSHRPTAYVTIALNVVVFFLFMTSKLFAVTAKTDFQNFCAQCHGVDGKGGSNLGDIQGPDLTHLSQKHGGNFPSQEVYEVIDGRKKLAGHERLLTMPLWGEFLQPQGVPEDVAEAKAKSRINALVHYIQTLQAK